MSQEIEPRQEIERAEVEEAPLTEWTIEICSVCRLTTEYDRDYGGPFPTTTCPRPDCRTNTDHTYGTCPSVENITVVEKRRDA